MVRCLLGLLLLFFSTIFHLAGVRDRRHDVPKGAVVMSGRNGSTENSCGSNKLTIKRIQKNDKVLFGINRVNWGFKDRTYSVIVISYLYACL